MIGDTTWSLIRPIINLLFSILRIPFALLYAILLLPLTFLKAAGVLIFSTAARIIETPVRMVAAILDELWVSEAFTHTFFRHP